MQQLREQIAMAAPTNGRVLIYGENGTGKELVARSVHALSRRRNGPFVEVNCAAIPEELIESELFGHMKGAFTGAVVGSARQVRAGRRRHAVSRRDRRHEPQDAGQGAARAAGAGRRAGRRRRAASRWTCACWPPPTRICRRRSGGRFREDLYFRLNVIPIFVPPLRDRPDDIPLLARALHDRVGARVRPAAEAVRRGRGGRPAQLPLARQRARAAQRGRAADDHGAGRHHPAGGLVVPGRGRRSSSLEEPGPVAPLHEARERFEREYILRALAAQHGNISRTAEVLGVERSNLYRKMRGFGIAPARRVEGEEEPA